MKPVSGLTVMASPDGGKHAVKIYQDVFIHLGRIEGKDRFFYEPKPGRGVWIQVTKGSLFLNQERLETGDGAAVENETALEMKAEETSEFLLFDLG